MMEVKIFIIFSVFLSVTILPSTVYCQIAFAGGRDTSTSTNPGNNFNRGNQNIRFDEAPAEQLPQCRAPNNRAGFCKPLAQCAIFFAEIPSLLDRPCETLDGQKGVCCPVETETGDPRNNGVLAKPPEPNVPVPRISKNQLEQTAQISIQKFKEQRDKITDILFSKNVVIEKGSPEASHQKFFTTTNAILDQGADAQLNIETSKNLINEFNLSPLQGTFALPKFSSKGTSVGSRCLPVSRCNLNYPYRTMDGSCNNRKNPDWGKSEFPLQRILPPQYGDGINSPRVAKNGAQLPSARLLSQNLYQDADRPYNNFTLMLMQWGQWMDHDLTHTPIVKGANQTGISCCQNGDFLPINLRHPDCFPIEIPQNDPFYAQFRQRCMHFVRSLPAPRRECNFGPREQMNQITSYFDGSNIYGSTETRARSLRQFSGGLLQTQNNKLLPSNPSECSSAGRFCFKAGDLRVNEQVDLALIHTIWLREHNRVATELSRLNPHWNDETLYQEARRIVIAELQFITYNEFLPLILGPEFMRKFQLQPGTGGHTRLYNENIDATITNAFAAAAYRFGHSMVQGSVKMFNQFGSSKSVPFVSTQFQPFAVYDQFDDLVRGLTSQQSQQADSFVSRAITNHLFGGSSGFGLDLMSLNIQRGRDHGLAPYNDWREICGLKRFSSWRQMEQEIDSETVRRLSRLYTSPEDVDLFVGGMGERAMPGSILGPTFICIVGDQFARLRRGDRFYFEETSAQFTQAQLEQIRKTSLARVLCDNSDNIVVIQPLVFQQATFLNKREPCNSDAIPKMNMRFWKERHNFNNNNNGGQVVFNNQRSNG